jgi:hypothetical protein
LAGREKEGIQKERKTAGNVPLSFGEIRLGSEWTVENQFVVAKDFNCHLQDFSSIV